MSFMMLKAPPFTSLFVFYSTGINPFEKAYYAINYHESKLDSMAYNPKDPNGGSHGISQIGLLRLKDYNKRTGKNYTVEDLYKIDVSREIFMFYASKYGPYKMDLIIRRWNGSGKATYAYLKKVRQHM